MSRVLLVHGIGQQYKGPESMLTECTPALRDGVRFAGGELAVEDISAAFYGDLFRPAGSRSIGWPDYDWSDVDETFEADLLLAWWQDSQPQHPTRARTPQWIQRALSVLSGTSFFAGLGERAMVGSLKQVRAYFCDPNVRAKIRERVQAAIAPETRVVIGHSLGSVIAYEALSSSANTPAKALITLGSPLGVRHLIFDRLTPAPRDGVGCWPSSIESWTNIADQGDVVALTKNLAPLFERSVVDVLVQNGAKAHDIRPYLTAAETGSAVLSGLTTEN
ncbi:hypothetical protein JOF56_010394 [Kibdelosporangium banguiense]|uniref:Alpha/beta hydrolase n=1 Tax=Kibdelosporangium banguiense TaxID=1365924 RepID=A0ABS4U1A3_9PSEU|nr:hypothetical protein [Kibdelosporangium banguiense]MBP2330009.1 hypothetical protein [Kibdelosporangium banguiense]